MANLLTDEQRAGFIEGDLHEMHTRFPMPQNPDDVLLLARRLKGAMYARRVAAVAFLNLQKDAQVCPESFAPALLFAELAVEATEVFVDRCLDDLDQASE